jgi:transposase
MTRSKIHHLAEAGVLQSEIAVQCGVGLRSVERVLAAPVPNLTDLQNGQASPRRQGRPRKADEAMVERFRLLLEGEPALPATEVPRP